MAYEWITMTQVILCQSQIHDLNHKKSRTIFSHLPLILSKAKEAVKISVPSSYVCKKTITQSNVNYTSHEKHENKIDNIKHIFNVFIVFCISCEFFIHVPCEETPFKTRISYAWKKNNLYLNIKATYTHSKDLFKIIFNPVVEGKRYKDKACNNVDNFYAVAIHCRR